MLKKLNLSKNLQKFISFEGIRGNGPSKAVSAADFYAIFQDCQRLNDTKVSHYFLDVFIVSEEKDKRSVTSALQCLSSSSSSSIKRIVEEESQAGKYVLELLSRTSRDILDEQHYSLALDVLQRSPKNGKEALQLAHFLVHQTSFPMSQILSSSILSFYSKLPEAEFESRESCDLILKNTMDLLTRMQKSNDNNTSNQTSSSSSSSSSSFSSLAAQHFSCAMVIAGRGKDYDLYSQLLEAMKEAGIEEDIYTLTAQMSALSYLQDLPAAFAVYQQMVSSGLKLKTTSMTKILQLCLHMKKPILGLEIASEWLNSERNNASWEVYRGVLFLIHQAEEVSENDDWKSHTHSCLRLLRKKLFQSYRSVQDEDKIPVKLLSFALSLLHDHGLLDEVFDFLPYSQISPLLVDEITFSILAILVKKKDIHRLSSLLERVSHHPKTTLPSLRTRLIGSLIGLYHTMGRSERADRLLAQNISSFEHQGILRTSKLFKAISEVSSSGVVKHVALQLWEQYKIKKKKESEESMTPFGETRNGEGGNVHFLCDALAFVDYADLVTLLTMFAEDTDTLLLLQGEGRRIAAKVL